LTTAPRSLHAARTVADTARDAGIGVRVVATIRPRGGGSVKTTILALACASSRLVAAAPGRAAIER
jgi:hypothetical protein